MKDNFKLSAGSVGGQGSARPTGADGGVGGQGSARPTGWR